MYDEDSKDLGFELPDTRHTFIDTEGKEVKVVIVRHWTRDEEGDDDWYPTFNIVRGRVITELPVGVDQVGAENIAHIMYKEDETATDDYNQVLAEEEYERRMGM